MFGFLLGGKKHFAEGEVWEINNIRSHAGGNEGSTSRIHMIVDVAKPLKTIEDRVHYFVNLELVAKRCGALLCRPHLDTESAPTDFLDFTEEPVQADKYVTKGVLVGLHHVVTDADTGQILSTDFTDEPLSYVHGYQQLPPKLEMALDGLKVGDKFSLQLSPESAYGFRSDKLIAEIPCEGPDGFQGVSVVGGKSPLFVLGTNRAKRRTVNANHPFAGRNLYIHGQIRHIRSLDPHENRFALYSGPTLGCERSRQSAFEEYLTAQ